MVTVYLIIWLVNFRYVYGWLMDDRLVYEKACKTVSDLLAPFRADDRNALHFYFYLISLLPAALPVKLDSYTLPLFGNQTGHYRFMLLYAVFLHAALLLMWAVFACKFSRSRAAAICSLVLFAASPSLFLWTPQPDSRYLGLLVGLPGAWLMISRIPGSDKNRRRQLLAGVLCSVALSIHYTSAYLLGPLAVCHWFIGMMTKGRRRSVLSELAWFTIAFMLPLAVVELVSRFVAGLPWERGPAMFAMQSGAQHASRFALQQNLQTWLQSAMSQMGPLLLVLIPAGWAIYFLRAFRGTTNSAQRTIALAIPLAVILLLVSGKMPFFRMTTVLQPFLFLFASIATLAIVKSASRGTWLRATLACVLLLAAGSHQARQAAAVYEGHQGLGRALELAHTNRSDRQINWLSIAWYGGSYGLFNPPDFRDPTVDSVLVSYFPASFVWGHPATSARLRDMTPLASFKTLWSTDAVHSEVSPYWPNNDWRIDPLMSEAKVFRMSDCVSTLEAVPIEVSSVVADSQLSPEYEPANVLDDGGSPDSHTSWKSESSQADHFLEIRFATGYRLDRVQIISPAMDAAAMTLKMDAVEILVDDGGGAFLSVWSAENLSSFTIIEASWQMRMVARMRIVIHRQTVDAWTLTSVAAIEEVVFPGYRPRGVAPRRNFPTLELTNVCWGKEGVLATSSGHGTHVVMELNGKAVSTRRTEYPDQLEGIVNRGNLEVPGEIEVRLKDDFRVSNFLRIQAEVPGLLAVHPSEMQVGQAFNVQPDGTYALSIDGANIIQGTRVVFAERPLKTAYGNDHWVTANLPTDQVLRPGTYSVWLENPCGRSNLLEFVVRP